MTTIEQMARAAYERDNPNAWARAQPDVRLGLVANMTAAVKLLRAEASCDAAHYLNLVLEEKP